MHLESVLPNNMLTCIEPFYNIMNTVGTEKHHDFHNTDGLVLDTALLGIL